jgi:hypothetical protein
MRVMFGLPGLVLTLFVVIQLVKIQTATTAPAPVQPTVVALFGVDLPAPQGNFKRVYGQHQQALHDAPKAGQQRLDAAEKP